MRDNDHVPLTDWCPVACVATPKSRPKRASLSQNRSERRAQKESDRTQSGQVKREPRYDYSAAVPMRYERSCREQKGWMLDEFCAATGYNRKYPIKLLRGPFPRVAPPMQG